MLKVRDHAITIYTQPSTVRGLPYKVDHCHLCIVSSGGVAGGGWRLGTKPMEQMGQTFYLWHFPEHNLQNTNRLNNRASKLNFNCFL